MKPIRTRIVAIALAVAAAAGVVKSIDVLARVEAAGPATLLAAKPAVRQVLDPVCPAEPVEGIVPAHCL